MRPVWICCKKKKERKEKAHDGDLHVIFIIAVVLAPKQNTPTLGTNETQRQLFPSCAQLIKWMSNAHLFTSSVDNVGTFTLDIDELKAESPTQKLQLPLSL